MTLSSRSIRRVRYVDTSIVLNLLNVPGRNEHRAAVTQEFHDAIQRDDVLILPLSSIIETGNHISHVPNGAERRKAAVAFTELLRKTARNQMPWTLDKLSFEAPDLEFYADNFVEYAQQEIGLGDLSIIHEFQRYVERVRGTVMNVRVEIWSLDHHLSGYVEDL